MPPGDLITDDYQAELNGVLMGAGTNYDFGPAGISGLLGIPKAKTADVDFDHKDGSRPSPDFMGVRTVLLHLNVEGIDPEDAFANFALLAIAWEPQGDSALVELHVQLPGIGHVYLNGRPSSLEEDVAAMKSGHLTAIGEFRALDPRRHTA